MWLFGRRRRKLDGPQPIVEGKAARKNNARPSSPKSPGAPTGITRKNSHNKSKRKRRKSSPHAASPLLEKENIAPTNPFDDVLDPIGSTENLTALPMASVPTSSPHLRPVTFRGDTPFVTVIHNDSGASLPSAREKGKLQRPGSLRKHDSAPVRRKSTKRKVDPVREAEIKAMSSPSAPIPVKRPATYSGGILRQESKKMKGGLNRNFERPTSNVSLPLAESIHSSMSGTSELRAFKVSSFDLFSARPSLRYSSSAPHSAKDINSLRTESRREKHPMYNDSKLEGVLEDPPTDKRSKNRIGDLADDMDTTSLREMMERDARRRKKKEKVEAEKLRAKLERRAEKQRSKEARKAGKQPETGTLERRRAPSIGLGIDTRSSTPRHSPQSPHFDHAAAASHDDDVTMEDEVAVQPTSPLEQYMHPRETPVSPLERPVHPLERPVHPLERPVHPLERPVHPLERPVHPLEIEAMEQLQRRPSSPYEGVTTPPMPTPFEEPEIHIATTQQIRYSRASMQAAPPSPRNHHRVPSNISQVAELISAKPQAQEQTAATEEKKRRRSSDTSSKRMGMWASIFRRNTRKSSEDQVKSSPSEASFSNTSRESMSRQPLPAHLVAPSPPPRTSSRASGVPTRTLSKFREDLPEYPLSPPDSRVQSPETTGVQPRAIPARRGQQPPSRLHMSADRTQQPTPETDGSDALDSPVSNDPRASKLMSRSMASVDSEGSWLSGKPMKRSSTRQKYRSSVSSVRKATEDFSASYEELGMADDEYFRRLTPTPEQALSAPTAVSRKPSSNAMGPSATVDEKTPMPDVSQISPYTQGGAEVLHSGVARTPTVVKREPYNRVKSQEGLLNTFEDDPSISDPEDPDQDHTETEEQAEEFKVARAKSIDLGKHHMRQVSAGSARLLDIKRISTQTSLPPTDSAPQSAK